MASNLVQTIIKKKKSKYIRLTENSSSYRKSSTWKIHVSKSTQRNDSMENRGRFTVRNAVQSNFRESKTIFGLLARQFAWNCTSLSPGRLSISFLPSISNRLQMLSISKFTIHPCSLLANYQLASLCFCNKFLIKEQININNIS